jgi:hypothetical protein
VTAGAVSDVALSLDGGPSRASRSAHVPYQSFRSGDYEVNVYGDPQRPAGLEVGVYKDLLKSHLAKTRCVEFLATVLTEPADRAVLRSLKLAQDTRERSGLTFEVTPETAADAYGGWWVSVYDRPALDRSRASDRELKEITVRRDEVKKAPAGGTGGTAWTLRDLTYARPAPSGSSGGGTVYVRGYTRKDGTYVRPHTRSAPGSGRRM